MFNINYEYRSPYSTNYYTQALPNTASYDILQDGNNNLIYSFFNNYFYNNGYKYQTPTKYIMPLKAQYQNDYAPYNYGTRTPSPSPIRKSLVNNNYNQVKLLSKSPEPYLRLYTKNYVKKEEYVSCYNINNYNNQINIKVSNVKKMIDNNRFSMPGVNFQAHEFRPKTPEPTLYSRKKTKKTKRKTKNQYNTKTFVPLNTIEMNNDYQLNNINLLGNTPNINNQNLERLTDVKNLSPYSNYSKLLTNNYYYQINNYPTKYIINQPNQNDINKGQINSNNYLNQNMNYYNERENRFKSHLLNNEDPTDNYSSADFIIVNQIGEGTFGKIYCVQWIKNNKFYAMKKIELKNIKELKQFQEKVRIVKDLNQKTNHYGFVKIYAENCVPIYGYQMSYIYYIIMELGERDWEKEIQLRIMHQRYYTEVELLQIINQLVKTLSLMQKYNVTHRDIKPQNILIKNGIYKICDFGEARVISGNGVVIQHIRGSQLYMSPILFYAYNHNILQVMHNSYKSDVFSLGMCILLAASLSGYALYEIRELVDINAISKIINNKLGGRYSINTINIITQMLQIDENLRMDFIQLEELLLQYWKN